MCENKSLFVMAKAINMKQLPTNKIFENMKVIYPVILNEPLISYTWGSRIKSFSLDLVIVLMVMGVLTWIVN